MSKNISYKIIGKCEMIITVLINFFIVLVLLESIDVRNNIKVLIIVLLSSVISVLWWKIVFKKPLIVPIVLIIFSIITAIINKFYEITYTLFTDKTADFINWTIRYISKLTFIHSSYLIILIVLLTFLIALITYVLVIKIRKTYPLIIIGTSLYLYEWFSYIDNSILYYGVFIFLVMFLYIIRKYMENECLWISENKKIPSNMFKRIMINSIIVCMLVIMSSAILPKNIDPISWRWLDDKAQKVFPVLVNWRNSQKGSSSYGGKNVFDMSFTQFQNDPKRLGGPVKVSNELVMEVKSDSPLYLRGRIKDFYTGSYWKTTKNVGYRQYSKSRISFITNEQAEYDMKGIIISHKNLTTSTVFNPSIPRMIVLGDDSYYATKEFELYTNYLILKDQAYTVYYFSPKIDWKAIYTSKYAGNDEFNKYLQLPETITERTYQLANDITKYQSSDYHKIKSIEHYLKTTFKYTLNPSETPYDSDFIDYFLFDLKEGYCTYYASSMAVLARCIGIPSRYVEGYRAVEKNENETYEVFGSNAHAWTEVYIEGYGWMTFEPTSGYSNAWMNAQQESEDELKETPIIDHSGLRRKNVLEILDDYEIANIDMDYNKEKSLENKNHEIYLRIAVILLVILVISILIYFSALINRKKKLHSNNNKVINYYYYVEKLLDNLNKNRLSSETTYEYYNKIGMSKLSDRSKQLIDIFNKACYSNEKVTLEEIEIVYSHVCKIEKSVKNGIGLINFIICKIYYKPHK